MSRDFAVALAGMAASVPELQACFVMRDGLVIDSYPEGSSEGVKRAWLRLAVMGDFDKGFLVFEEEAWICLQRGAWAVCAIATPSARSGLLMNLADELLEEVTTAQQPDVPEMPVMPARKPTVWTRVSQDEASADEADAEEGAKPGTSERRPRPVSWIRAPRSETKHSTTQKN